MWCAVLSCCHGKQWASGNARRPYGRRFEPQSGEFGDLYGNMQDGGNFAIEEDTGTVVLEFPEAMKVNTLHRMFKFLNKTDMEVQTSICHAATL